MGIDIFVLKEYIMPLPTVEEVLKKMGELRTSCVYVAFWACKEPAATYEVLVQRLVEVLKKPSPYPVLDVVVHDRTERSIIIEMLRWNLTRDEVEVIRNVEAILRERRH